jgi:hypothetical protein
MEQMPSNESSAYDSTPCWHLQEFREFLHHRGQFAGPLCFQARNVIGVAVALGDSFLDMAPPRAAPHVAPVQEKVKSWPIPPALTDPCR